MADATLYDRLGREPAVGAVVSEFDDRVLAAERIVHHFDDVEMNDQHSHQTKFLSAVTGGLMQYKRDDMQTAHESMGVSDTEFDAIATHLDDAPQGFESVTPTARR